LPRVYDWGRPGALKERRISVSLGPAACLVKKEQKADLPTSLEATEMIGKHKNTARYQDNKRDKQRENLLESKARPQSIMFRTPLLPCPAYSP
jgi:hypothetical protein